MNFRLSPRLSFYAMITFLVLVRIKRRKEASNVINPDAEKYRDALSLGWEQLSRKNPVEVVERGHVEYEANSEVYQVEMLNSRYTVDLRKRKVIQQPSAIPVRPVYAILIIHYLVNVKRTEITGELLTLKSPKIGGSAYYGAFLQRAIKPLAKRFGNNSEELLQAGKKFGARSLDTGDASIELLVFPKIPLTVIIYEGEEGIPGGANILYDQSASDHLHPEDLAVIGELVAHKLIKE
ncbi:MAG: DUF3786 domain-containing protein [Candidatus Odinarchaeota archaeon]